MGRSAQGTAWDKALPEGSLGGFRSKICRPARVYYNVTLAPSLWAGGLLPPPGLEAGFLLLVWSYLLSVSGCHGGGWGKATLPLGGATQGVSTANSTCQWCH